MKASCVSIAKLAVFLACLCAVNPARANIFETTTQPSEEFLTLLTQIRDLLNTAGAAQNSNRCGESVIAEARLTTPRTLSSGVSTVSPTSDNEYFTRDIAPGGITGNQCSVNYTAMWIKGAKGSTAGNAGLIRVMLTMVCPCKAGAGGLKSGSMSFSVPVNRTKLPNGTTALKIGPASKYVVEAECCNGRKEPKSYLDPNGGLIGVIPDPDAVKPPATTPPQPPRTATPYTPPPPPPAPRPAPPPGKKVLQNWTVENPCPECEPIRQHMVREQQAADSAQRMAEEFERQLRDNQLKQEEAQVKIAQLTRELGRQEGTGGSAYDPDTGNTTDAWTQSDGSVKITVRDANGNIIEERTRPSRASTKIREDIAKEQAKLKELEAQRAQLQKELEYAQKLKAKHLKLAADLLALLQDCIKEKCRGEPLEFSCVMPASKPIVIGPQEKFGETAESKVAGVATGILGSAIGGFLGGGRGGGDSGGSGPELKNDPVKNKQTLTDPTTGMKLQIGTQWMNDGRLLASVNVDYAPEGEPVIHQMYRQRLEPKLTTTPAPAAKPTAEDLAREYINRPIQVTSGYYSESEPGCDVDVQQPISWEPYKTWEAWWAKLRIQVWRSTDGGPWVKTKDTGWMDWGSGINALETGVMSEAEIPKTAWGSTGTSKPVGIPRAAGAYFDYRQPVVYDKPAPERFEIHFAEAWKNPVSTILMHLYPTYYKDGRVIFDTKPPEFKWRIPPDFKPKMGGGMQQIDPPKPEEPGSILDEIEYVPVIS